MDYTLDFSAVAAHADLFATGAEMTALITLVCCCGGFAIAVACNALRQSERVWVRKCIATYVDIVRNTPFLVQLFFLYFGLSSLGWRLDAQITGLFALSLYSGAYQTEILAGSIAALPHAQKEAAAALGLSPPQLFLRILLPQAIETGFPALKSQFVLTLMASSIISVLAVHELSNVSGEISTETYRSFEVYTVASLIYLAMVVVLRTLLSIIGTLCFQRSRRKLAKRFIRPKVRIVARERSLVA